MIPTLARANYAPILTLLLLVGVLVFKLPDVLPVQGAAAVDSVVNLTLINANTNQPIVTFDPLTSGATIDLAVVGNDLNIRADTNPATVGSVRFALDGNNNYQTENVAPYALAGDTDGNYKSWTPSLGSHTVTATAYSGTNGGGTAGTPLTINFTVTNGGTPPTSTATPTPAGPTSTPAPTTPPSDEGTVSGILTKWHPITVSFAGPTVNESDETPNPFLGYRLQVTFTGPSGQVYNVPGFFAGDGNGMGTGNAWQVRFSADEAGEWSYRASFRTGNNVAIDLNPNAGSPTSFDNAGGIFTVAGLDGNAAGFLRWGRLAYTGGHYLKFADGPYWIKGGIDSPENFFGFADFDNTIDQGCKGIIHQYPSHMADWQIGDPTWNNGKGKGIIGAFNYLNSQRVNSIYFLPMNLGGDGCETYPFVGASGSTFDNTHYDISKLHQWNIAMNHAQEQGIALHFVLNETESGNENWLDNGSLGVERKLFYRELIARFGYIMAIKWNLSEENDFSSANLQAFADYISQLDWAEHQLTVHTKPNALGLYDPLLGNANFDTTSIQYDPNRAGQHVETMWERSANAGRPWVIDMDENNPAGTGLTDSNADDLRKRVLYDVYFSGGQIEWYFGYHNLPLGGDMKTEDFRTRQAMYGYMWHARNFMQTHLPFWEMAPADQLLAGEDGAFGGGEVFAKVGDSYAVYLPEASNSNATLDLAGAAGQFEKRWFNPRTGEFAGTTEIVSGNQTLTIGLPPADTGNDWVLLVKKKETTSATPTPATTRRILLFSKTAGFRHASIPDAIAAIEALGTANTFTVDKTEDATRFNATTLAQYDAVVFLMTTGNVLNDAQQAAFEGYIQSGGGYVGIHSASDTEYDWPWYGDLMGAFFADHPSIQTATIDVEDQIHSSTAHFGETWIRNDEWYNFQRNPRSNVNVLLSLDESTYSGGTMGDHPIAWYHEFDGGRAWYTGGGHTKASYAEADFMQHILGGIQYAAGWGNTPPPTATPTPTALPTGQVTPTGTATTQPTATMIPTATPSPTPTIQPEVINFTLVNADTDEDIGPLVNDDVIVLSTLPTQNLNVRANINPATVGSVRFALNGNNKYRIENVLPYALKGDRQGNYYPWTPAIGEHTLTATPYTRSKGRGEAGIPLSITFRVTDQPENARQNDPIVAEPASTANLNGMVLLPIRNQEDRSTTAKQSTGQSIPSLQLIAPDTSTIPVALDTDGSFLQTELVAGTYSVHLTLSEELMITNSDALTIVLAAGSNNELPDMGIIDRSANPNVFLPLVVR